MANSTFTLNGRILEAITVDFWGTIAFDNTLMERRKLRAQYMLEWMNSLGSEVTFDQLVEELQQYSELWHQDWKRKRITHDAEHIVRFIVEKFSVNATDEQIRELATKLDMALKEVLPEMMQDADVVLRDIAARGIKLAIISDTAISGPDSLDWLLGEWGLLDLFPVRVYSENTGVAKPHPKAYLTASQELGVPQHRLMHIGDLESTDIIGAKSIGIAAMRFDGLKPETECKTCSMADKVVNSWKEVELILFGSKESSSDPFLKVETSAS